MCNYYSSAFIVDPLGVFGKGRYIRSDIYGNTDTDNFIMHFYL